MARHAVSVGVISGRHTIHHEGAESLGLGNGAVLVGEQKGLEVHNLLTELSHRSGQRIILGGEKLNLRLQVGQPLLLALTTF